MVNSVGHLDVAGWPAGVLGAHLIGLWIERIWEQAATLPPLVLRLQAHAVNSGFPRITNRPVLYLPTSKSLLTKDTEG